MENTLGTIKATVFAEEELAGWLNLAEYPEAKITEEQEESIIEVLTNILKDLETNTSYSDMGSMCTDYLSAVLG